MFGLGIERGLTVQEEGLDPGYVLCVVPNSASVYLMDRDAQVVHEWKGNYGVLGAYLSDDGSLHQNVYDPDFLTFAGGGETGRLQHITWDSKIVWDYEYNSKDYHAHHDFEVKVNGLRRLANPDQFQSSRGCRQSVPPEDWTGAGTSARCRRAPGRAVAGRSCRIRTAAAGGCAATSRW